MTKWGRRAVWLMLILLVLGFAVVERHVREGDAKIPQENRIDILPSKELAPMLSLGFRYAWAELILLQTQIYITDNRLFGTYEGGKRLKAMFELIHELDPHYVEAILFGAVSLSEFWGYVGVADGNDLLRMGMHSNPDDYRFSRTLGFQYYLYGGDFPENRRQAVKWFRLCLTYEDCPKGTVWIVDALMKGERNGIKLHADMLCAMCKDAKEDNQRKHLCTRCRYYSLLEQLDDLRKRFEADTGRTIQSPMDLVRAGYLQALPPDPMGGQWKINGSGELFSSEMAEDQSSADLK